MYQTFHFSHFPFQAPVICLGQAPTMCSAQYQVVVEGRGEMLRTAFLPWAHVVWEERPAHLSQDRARGSALAQGA